MRIVAPTSWASRPIRSSFATTNTSPSRILSSRMWNWGRPLAGTLPLTPSSANQYVTWYPARSSSSRWFSLCCSLVLTPRVQPIVSGVDLRQCGFGPVQIAARSGPIASTVAWRGLWPKLSGHYRVSDHPSCVRRSSSRTFWRMLLDRCTRHASAKFAGNNVSLAILVLAIDTVNRVVRFAKEAKCLVRIWSIRLQ